MVKGILIFILIMIALCLLVAVFDCNRFVIVDYEVSSAKIRKPCKMIVLSDLHNKSFGKANERLLRKIESISPDAILIAGDMLTATKGKDFTPALSLMEALSGKYRIYYGMGNHEYRLGLYPEQYGDMYDRYMEELSQMGIEPLVNERTQLPDVNVSVCGVAIGKEYYRRFHSRRMEPEYLTELLGEPSRDSYQILIAHNPEYFDAYAAWGADLVVSGHVHGGIMRLPFLGGVLSPNLTLFPKYDGGRFEQNGSVMLLSRGLGTHTIPLRIFNPGELPVIHMKPGR